MVTTTYANDSAGRETFVADYLTGLDAATLAAAAHRDDEDAYWGWAVLIAERDEDPRPASRWASAYRELFGEEVWAASR